MATTSAMKKINLPCVVLMMMSMVMIMSTNAPKAHAALACGNVVGYLRPCLAYLGQGGAGTPPSICCSGVAALNNAARTTPDRQAACKCLKGVAGSLPPAAVAAAAGIPSKCGVNVPYKIAPSTDCSRVV